MTGKFVIMGVAGCGKTKVGETLAARHGWNFRDGDMLHPQANIDKMAAGTPLTDEDRTPWLILVSETLARGPDPIAVGCSALKRRYRDLIRSVAGTDVCFIFLNGPRELIEKRMSARDGHFMPLTLLDSQFATLEVPEADEHFIEVDISGDIESVIDQISRKLEANFP